MITKIIFNGVELRNIRFTLRGIEITVWIDGSAYSGNGKVDGLEVFVNHKPCTLIELLLYKPKGFCVNGERYFAHVMTKADLAIMDCLEFVKVVDYPRSKVTESLPNVAEVYFVDWMSGIVSPSSKSSVTTIAEIIVVSLLTGKAKKSTFDGVYCFPLKLKKDMLYIHSINYAGEICRSYRFKIIDIESLYANIAKYKLIMYPDLDCVNNIQLHNGTLRIEER